VSTYWEFAALMSASSLGKTQVRDLLDGLQRAGAELDEVSGQIYVETYGAQTSVASSGSEVADVLSHEGGSISLKDRYGAFVGLGLTVFPSSTSHRQADRVNEVALSVLARTLEAPAEWSRMKAMCLVLCATAESPYGFGLDDDAFETLPGVECLQDRIAADRLPPVVPALSIYKLSTQLGARMEAAAQVTGLHSAHEGTRGVIDAGAGAVPSVTSLKRLSEIWRSALRDPGCP
jgi:hypothetical protein